MLKADIRRKLRNIEIKDDISNQIYKQLKELPVFNGADTIFLYMPLKDEPDLKVLLSCGKKIALPVCEESDMHFSLFTGKLTSGKYNIPIPIDDIEITPDSRTIILVPAIAFDKRGFRVGRGKGYYDRYLKKYPNAFTIGVTESTRVFDEISAENHDVPVKALLTEKGYALL